MSRNLNFKIVGSGPTGLLLALSLSKLNTNIYLTDLLNEEKLIKKDKTYAITHSTQKILSKFNLWDKLKSSIFGFDTLSISDREVSCNSLLTTDDLDKDLRLKNNIGWVVKHSDLMKVFFEEVEKCKNIFFTSPKSLSLEKVSYDYVFFSNGANSNIQKRNNLLDINRFYDQSCLTFKVLIRGNVNKRAYEIFRKEGPLALLPLESNLYQIIWTDRTDKSIDRLNSCKSFLLDNLSTILPNNFKLYEILGNVNIFPVSLSLKFPSLNQKKFIFVGDSFHTFHPVGGQGLNICWRDVNSIFNILSKGSRVNNISKSSLTHLKYKYYLVRLIDISITMVVTDFLIRIFANRNFILLPIRKIIFFVLNKNSYLRKLILNHMTKSIAFKSIN